MNVDLISTYIFLKVDSEFALYGYILNYIRCWPCAIVKTPFSIIYSKFSISFQRREPLQNNNFVLKLPMKNLNVWKYIIRKKLSFDKIENIIIIENADKTEYKKRRRIYLFKFQIFVILLNNWRSNRQYIFIKIVRNFIIPI
jgi:hypothetical protein